MNSIKDQNRENSGDRAAHSLGLLLGAYLKTKFSLGISFALSHVHALNFGYFAYFKNNLYKNMKIAHKFKMFLCNWEIFPCTIICSQNSVIKTIQNISFLYF